MRGWGQTYYKEEEEEEAKREKMMKSRRQRAAMIEWTKDNPSQEDLRP
jgi:hypothetical protein